MQPRRDFSLAGAAFLFLLWYCWHHTCIILLYSFRFLLLGGNFHNLAGHIAESGVINAQSGGSFGVDGDDAAIHYMVFRNVAAFQDIQHHISHHISGVGAKFGIVDSAGCKGTGG